MEGSGWRVRRQAKRTTHCGWAFLLRARINQPLRPGCEGITQTQPKTMVALLFEPIVAAAGYSLLYLLLGGGFLGAVIIFVVLMMFGK